MQHYEEEYCWLWQADQPNPLQADILSTFKANVMLFMSQQSCWLAKACGTILYCSILQKHYRFALYW